MPIVSASALLREPFYKVLVMGPAKSGKTTSVVTTSPGPVLVILCESTSALLGAARRSKSFDYEHITGGFNSMLKAMVAIKEEVKAGKYKTIIVDPLSDWAARVERECLDATNNDQGVPDGRRAYPVFLDRMRHFHNQLFTLPAHVIAITHFYERGEGQHVPLIAGKAGEWVRGAYQDVVWFEHDSKTGKRFFRTAPGDGINGPGCRHLDGIASIEPDVSKLFAAFEKGATMKVSTDAPSKSNGEVKRLAPRATR